MQKIIVLFGVSGCGKSIIGKRLSEDLEFHFIEGDYFHSNDNINKMKNKTPLNDLDRELWLDNINAEVKNSETKNIVLACSALKEKYRKRLIKEIDADIFWFCLKGDFDLIKERLVKRKNHFFNPDMLQSQFDIIEYPDYCTFIDIKYKPQVIVDLIKSKL